MEPSEELSFNSTTIPNTVSWQENACGRVDQDVINYNDEATERRRRGRKSAYHDALPYGYASHNSSNQLSLAELSELICTATSSPKNTPTLSPKNALPTILFYWARGSSNSGDELKMSELGFPSNEYFAHIVDIQPWFQQEFPEKGEKHRLSEAAALVGVPFFGQKDLIALPPKKRQETTAPIQHNAGDDACTTLRVALEIISQRGLYGVYEVFHADYMLMGIDFEGGGNKGHGITEIGISSISTRILREHLNDWDTFVDTKHGFVSDFVDCHLHPAAQRKMGIDARRADTYPRYNFRSGPSGTRKSNTTVKNGHGQIRKISLSPDTAIISFDDIRTWMMQHIRAPLVHLNHEDGPVSVVVDETESKALNGKAGMGQVLPAHASENGLHDEISKVNVKYHNRQELDFEDEALKGGPQYSRSSVHQVDEMFPQVVSMITNGRKVDD